MPGNDAPVVSGFHGSGIVPSVEDNSLGILVRHDGDRLEDAYTVAILSACAELVTGL
jgi:hypothetical protein